MRWWCIFLMPVVWAYGQSPFEPPITIQDDQSGIWKIISCGKGQSFAVVGGGKISFFNQQSLETGVPNAHTNFFRDATIGACSPDGKKIALIDHLGGIEPRSSRGLLLWDIEADTVDSLENPDLFVPVSAEFSPDASRLAVISQSIDFNAERLILIDVNRMEPIATLQLVRLNSAFSATFSPNWHWLVASRTIGGGIVGGEPKPDVKLWDMTTLEEVRTLFDTGPSLYCCGHAKAIFTADNGQILLPDNDLIRTYDVLLQRELEPFDTGKIAIADLTLSSQGSYLASYSREGFPDDFETLIWDWKTHTLIGSVVNRTPGIFSPDESLLAFTGPMRTVRLWSLEERRELEPLTGFEGGFEAPISDIAFTADGSALVTVSTSGVVQLWKRNKATAVAEPTRSVLPKQTYLGAAYPNPANPEVWIPYGLAEAGETRIRIFNIAGQLMYQRELGRQVAGYYTGNSAAYWDGRDRGGQPVSSGVYVAVLESGTASVTTKFVLAK